MTDKKKTGFAINPSNINRKGRPRKDTSLSELMRDKLDEQAKSKGEPLKITYKEAFVEKVLALALAGDGPSIKLIWSYIDGMPTQKVFTKDLDELKDIPIDELSKIINERLDDGEGEEESS